MGLGRRVESSLTLVQQIRSPIFPSLLFPFPLPPFRFLFPFLSPPLSIPRSILPPRLPLPLPAFRGTTKTRSARYACTPKACKCSNAPDPSQSASGRVCRQNRLGHWVKDLRVWSRACEEFPLPLARRDDDEPRRPVTSSRTRRAWVRSRRAPRERGRSSRFARRKAPPVRASSEPTDREVLVNTPSHATEMIFGCK